MCYLPEKVVMICIPLDCEPKSVFINVIKRISHPRNKFVHNLCKTTYMAKNTKT